MPLSPQKSCTTLRASAQRLEEWPSGRQRCLATSGQDKTEPTMILFSAQTFSGEFRPEGSTDLSLPGRFSRRDGTSGARFKWQPTREGARWRESLDKDEGFRL